MHIEPKKNKKKILIAEDEENILNLIKIILGDEFELSIARDGEEVYDVLKKITPDLIILDIMLPKVNGFEICEKLKSQPKTRIIKILILSAKGMKKDVEQGMKAGADYYLTKPFDPQELEKKILELLKLRS